MNPREALTNSSEALTRIPSQDPVSQDLRTQVLLGQARAYAHLGEWPKVPPILEPLPIRAAPDVAHKGVLTLLARGILNPPDEGNFHQFLTSLEKLRMDKRDKESVGTDGNLILREKVAG
jgi:hypothetical protein